MYDGLGQKKLDTYDFYRLSWQELSIIPLRTKHIVYMACRKFKSLTIHQISKNIEHISTGFNIIEFLKYKNIT